MTHDHAKELLQHVGAGRTDAETNRAAARLVEDLNLPPVMLGPDSTARIDDELARVRCGCGNYKPSAVQSHDEPKRTGAGLLPEGTDARLPGDIAAQFADLRRTLDGARAICDKALAAHEAWKNGRGKA